MTLRPYQQDFLNRFASRKDQRLLMLWATSAGKTRSAIEAMKEIHAKRILIVCPAIARGTWLAEFEKWSDYKPMAIRIGATRTSGVTKKEHIYREAAYDADVQVVSYGLLGQLDSDRYDFIVLDEFHALRAPLSKQSKIVTQLFRFNAETPALALSATGIPTDPKQLWNPLNTFWPGQWGPPTPTNDISWKFQAMYCEKIVTEYGTAYKGAKSDDALKQLSRALDPFVHRVSDKEVAQFLPPLHAEALRLDTKEDLSDIASEWLETLPEDARPIVICFKRETASNLAEDLNAFKIDGTISPERRVEILAQAKLIVATSESIRESISLSVYTHALIFEWRTSPASAIQLLGRFARQDALDLMRPTYVQYVCFPGDETKADILQERVGVVNAVLQRDSKAERLQEIFAPQELTEERVEKMFMSMLGTIITTNLEDAGVE